MSVSINESKNSIVNDRVSSFIRSFYPDDEGFLRELYASAKERRIPVIREDTRELFRLLLSMQKPDRILEIGTAVGYSALLMHSCCPLASITTMELDPERIVEAKENFRKCGVLAETEEEGRLLLLEGDAAELLKTLTGTYDFIFVDAAKAQYTYYLPELLRLSKYGTVILSDNVLQEGNILESHFSVEKRDRTIHDRMREYLFRITHTEGLTTSILPVGDGVAVTHVGMQQ